MKPYDTQRNKISILGTSGPAQWKVAGRASAIGIELALATWIGFLGGRWLDTQLGTKPWLMWLGLLLGVIAGFRDLFLLARRTHKDLVATHPEP